MPLSDWGSSARLPQSSFTCQKWKAYFKWNNRMKLQVLMKFWNHVRRKKVKLCQKSFISFFRTCVNILHINCISHEPTSFSISYCLLLKWKVINGFINRTTEKVQDNICTFWIYHYFASIFLVGEDWYHFPTSLCRRWARWENNPPSRNDRILTGSVSIVLRCDDKASTAKQLKRTPLITEYQKSLEGSNMTKVTTKSA